MLKDQHPDSRSVMQGLKTNSCICFAVGLGGREGHGGEAKGPNNLGIYPLVISCSYRKSQFSIGKSSHKLSIDGPFSIAKCQKARG